MTVLVLALGLLAALCYSLSDFFEQRAASRETRPADPDAPPPTGVLGRIGGALAGAGGTLHRLLHDRLWFAGWVVGTAAYLIQAAALHLGSVSVVQSLQVSSLLFALPLSTVRRNRQVHALDWLGGAAVAGGLALFLVARGTSSGTADRPLILVLIGAALGAAAVLAGLGALRSGTVRATLLACAAGLALATSASMVKLTTDDLTTGGIPRTATDWPGYGLAVAALIGLLLQQAAFGSGKLPVAVTAMTIANPAVGSLIGLIGFREGLPSGALPILSAVAALLLVAAGVLVLAHSPLLTGSEEDDGPAGGGASGNRRGTLEPEEAAA